MLREIAFPVRWPGAGPALCSATAFCLRSGCATEKLFATRGQESSGRCRELDGEPGNRRDKGRHLMEKAARSHCVFSPLFVQRFSSIRHNSGPPTTPFNSLSASVVQENSRHYFQVRGYMPYNLSSPCPTKKYR